MLPFASSQVTINVALASSAPVESMPWLLYYVCGVLGRTTSPSASARNAVARSDRFTRGDGATPKLSREISADLQRLEPTLADPDWDR